MSEAAWDKAFTQGSKAMQDRLRKVHAKNAKFQSWLQKSGHAAGASVKQASKEVKPSARVKSLQVKSLKAYGATKGLKMGGEDGSGEAIRDTVAPLTRDQHSKVQAAERAAKAAAKTTSPKKPKVKKPLSQAERMAAIASAVKKAKSKSRFDVPTVDPDDLDHDDLRDVHQSLHVRRGYNEEMNIEEGKMKDIVTDREETARLAAQKEPPFTPDKKKVRRGSGGPMSQAKWLAKQAMMKAMKKEEVEQIDEMDKSQPSSSRGAEGLPLGKKAEPAKTDKVKSDALKALQKQYKKVKEEVEQIDERNKENKVKKDAFVSKIGQTEKDRMVKSYTDMPIEKNYGAAAHARNLEAVKGTHVKTYGRGEVQTDNVPRSKKYKGSYEFSNVGEEVEVVAEQNDTTEKLEMAQTQLHFIRYAANEILEFIKMGGEVEEWYQNKLSKVHSDMESLHSYIEGEMRRTGMKEEVEQVNEEKLDPVGKEDSDINNDGKADKTDVYLAKKRTAIGKSIKDRLAKKLGAKEGK